MEEFDNNDNPIGARIESFIESEQMTGLKFCEIMEVNPSTLSQFKYRKSKPGFNFISRFLQRFPEVNPDWLINGEGEMYRDGVRPKETKTLSPEDNTPVQRIIDLFSFEDTIPASDTQTDIDSSEVLVQHSLPEYTPSSSSETQPEIPTPVAQPESAAPAAQPEIPTPVAQPESAVPTAETQTEIPTPVAQPESVVPTAETQPEIPTQVAQPESAVPTAETQPEIPTPVAQPESVVPTAETQPEIPTQVAHPESAAAAAQTEIPKPVAETKPVIPSQGSKKDLDLPEFRTDAKVIKIVMFYDDMTFVEYDKR